MRLPLWVAPLGRCAVGATLLTAVAFKLTEARPALPAVERGVEVFAALIAAHGLVPPALALATAWAVVAAEIVLGALLLRPGAGARSAWAAAALLGAFSAYLGAVAAVQPAARCGCFGEVEAGDLAFGVARNSVLLAALAPTVLTGCRAVVS